MLCSLLTTLPLKSFAEMEVYYIENGHKKALFIGRTTNFRVPPPPKNDWIILFYSFILIFFYEGLTLFPIKKLLLCLPLLF